MIERKEFLDATFLQLQASRTMSWLEAGDILPRPNHRVQLYGKDGHQEVGSFDHSIGMWNVRGQPVPFETFTHWKLLGEGPKLG
jgi:hypothetical protein